MFAPVERSGHKNDSIDDNDVHRERRSAIEDIAFLNWCAPITTLWSDTASRYRTRRRRRLLSSNRLDLIYGRRPNWRLPNERCNEVSCLGRQQLQRYRRQIAAHFAGPWRLIHCSNGSSGCSNQREQSTKSSGPSNVSSNDNWIELQSVVVIMMILIGYVVVVAAFAVLRSYGT